MGIGRVGWGMGRNDVNTVYLREVCLTLLQPGSRQRCWTPCQVVKWFFSVVLSQSFLMTFTKENRDEDRLMVGSIRSLGYLLPLHLDPGVPFLLKKAPGFSSALTHSSSHGDCRDRRELILILRGKESLSWASQGSVHPMLIHYLYPVLG